YLPWSCSRCLSSLRIGEAPNPRHDAAESNLLSDTRRDIERRQRGANRLWPLFHKDWPPGRAQTHDVVGLRHVDALSCLVSLLPSNTASRRNPLSRTRAFPSAIFHTPHIAYHPGRDRSAV